jgi:hypothetical protein
MKLLFGAFHSQGRRGALVGIGTFVHDKRTHVSIISFRIVSTGGHTCLRCEEKKEYVRWRCCVRGLSFYQVGGRRLNGRRTVGSAGCSMAPKALIHSETRLFLNFSFTCVLQLSPFNGSKRNDREAWWDHRYIESYANDPWRAAPLASEGVFALEFLRRSIQFLLWLYI